MFEVAFLMMMMCVIVGVTAFTPPPVKLPCGSQDIRQCGILLPSSGLSRAGLSSPLSPIPSRGLPFPSSSSTALFNLFDRFARVAKSNLNNLAKNLEDPEKIMTQALTDMQVNSGVTGLKSRTRLPKSSPPNNPNHLNSQHKRRLTS